MRERLINIIRRNVMVTCFNDALLGMSMWLFIGTLDVPVYATLIKISTMFGKTLAGHIEQRWSHLEDEKLMNNSILSETIRACLYMFGNSIIMFDARIGLATIAVASMSNGVNSALINLYQQRANCLLNEDVRDRSKFIGGLRLLNSITSTIGLLINLAIMAICQFMKVDQVKVLYGLMLIHAIIGIYDLYVTLMERKITKEFLLQEGKRL